MPFTTFAGRVFDVDFQAQTITITEDAGGALVVDRDKDYFAMLFEAWASLNPVLAVSNQVPSMRPGWTMKQAKQAKTPGWFSIEATIKGREVVFDLGASVVAVTPTGVRFPTLKDEEYEAAAAAVWGGAFPIRRVHGSEIIPSTGWTVTDGTR